MRQVLDVALQMVDQGRDKASPGETIHAVGHGVIRQLYAMQASDAQSAGDADDQ